MNILGTKGASLGIVGMGSLPEAPAHASDIVGTSERILTHSRCPRMGFASPREVFLADSEPSTHGRFCCRSPLLAFAKGDSVALTRFAAEASDDGAAEARAGAAFLRVSARRGDTGRSPCARDRRRARSDLGAC